jgi:hypothetical protein
MYVHVSEHGILCPKKDPLTMMPQNAAFFWPHFYRPPCPGGAAQRSSQLPE